MTCGAGELSNRPPCHAWGSTWRSDLGVSEAQLWRRAYLPKGGTSSVASALWAAATAAVSNRGPRAATWFRSPPRAQCTASEPASSRDHLRGFLIHVGSRHARRWSREVTLSLVRDASLVRRLALSPRGIVPAATTAAMSHPRTDLFFFFHPRDIDQVFPGLKSTRPAIPPTCDHPAAYARKPGFFA